MTFFDTYSYKQKNYALLLLVILLGAVIYKRSISNTIELIAYKAELNDNVLRAESAVQDIQTVKKQIETLNSLLGKENCTVEKVQHGFLNFFAKRAKGITVHQIDEVHTFKHPDFSIKTHRIILKGGYLETLRFINALELDFDLARLITVSCEYQKQSGEEYEALYTTILLQNYLL